MKIVIISDLHGNFPALQAVLQDLPSNDGIICCGDIVGYYPDVNEVCDEVRKLNVQTIRGNHDAYVTKNLTPASDKAEIYKTVWTRKNLSDANFRWLKMLPAQMDFDFNGLLVKVRHANFQEEESYLYPDSQKLKEFTLNENEIVLFGHTHHPMLIKAGAGLIVNPGSVGQPRDYNPQSSYSILDTDNRSIEFRRVNYNVAAYQEKLKK